jgi:ABC-type branched-subunit amino acid transport system ATPase component
MTMLEVDGISARYGMHNALRSVTIRVDRGEVVSVLGANGAGKSTLLKVIAGMTQASEIGRLMFDGQNLADMAAHSRVELGIAYVPDNRGVFGDLTVRENLFLGAYPQRARAGEAGTFDHLLRLFPRLQERLGQQVKTMSGGEQQMVAIGRALMSKPDLLLLDEPSLGLSPLMVGELFKALAQIRQASVAILIVEQNAKRSLELSDRAYLLEQGQIVGQGSASDLLESDAVKRAYLGG